jgi:hypothetical protein
VRRIIGKLSFGHDEALAFPAVTFIDPGHY